MVEINTIYRSSLAWVQLLSSSYQAGYREQDYNQLPAVSFPLKSAFGYSSGNFNQIVDSETVLIELADTEFEVAKFSAFTQDITLSIQFSEAGFRLIDELVKWNKPVETLKRTPEIETLVRWFLSTYSKNSRLLNDELINELLLNHIFDRHMTFLRIQAIKPRENITVDSAKDFIHDHISEDLTLSDISSAANISPFHFSRIFRQKTGYSPYDYLLKTRIANAQQLLKNGSSVTSTAFEVGFNSLENFSYCFRKMVGRSPSKFKKSKISKTF